MTLLLAEASTFWQFLLGFALFLASGFLILLIMVQRGRGGGLTGALGGMGGASAFGTKAGDVFTKITIVTAIIWIFLCIVTIQTLNSNPTAGAGQAKSGSLQSEYHPPGSSGRLPAAAAC